MKYNQNNLAADASLSSCQRKYTESPPLDLIDQLSSIPYPEFCPISRETWSVLPYALRYTGARLGDLAKLEGKDIGIIESIPAIRMSAGKMKFRKCNMTIDRQNVVPIHPKIQDLLGKLARERPKRLFPDIGETKKRHADIFCIRHGHVFRRWWGSRAKQIWPNMNIMSWRAHFIRHLSYQGGVPESIICDLVGLRSSSIGNKWPTRASIAQLYQAICKLP